MSRKALLESGFQNITEHDVEVIQYVSAMVSHRAAIFVSITTSVILKRIYENDLTIAIDGSVYKKHPRMNGWLNRLIALLNTSGKTVNLNINMKKTKINLSMKFCFMHFVSVPYDASRGWKWKGCCINCRHCTQIRR